MVRLGTSCLRRLSEGSATVEIRFGRLLRHPKVTVERLVAGWSEGTAAAVAGRHVLAIQDTTELHFRTNRDHDRGLGAIGNGIGRGVLLHPMIALDAGTGECLGLAGGRLWNREPPRPGPRLPKKNNGRRPLAEKESRHWVETAQDAKAILSSAATVTMIADREADLYPLWASVPGPNIHVLGRIFHDRKRVGGGTLYTAAAAWPVLGRREIAVRERPDRPARKAALEVRAGEVVIARPMEPRKSALPEQIALTLIEVIEPAPTACSSSPPSRRAPPSSLSSSPKRATAKPASTAPSSSRPPSSTPSKPSIESTTDQNPAAAILTPDVASHGPPGSSPAWADGTARQIEQPNHQAQSPSNMGSTSCKPWRRAGSCEICTSPRTKVGIHSSENSNVGTMDPDFRRDDE